MGQLEKVKSLIGVVVEVAYGGSAAGCLKARQQVDHGVAHGRQHLRGRPLTYPAAVLTQRHVAHVVQLVLYPPVTAHKPQKDVPSVLHPPKK